MELDTFFSNEKQATPPSLSENRSLKLAKKKLKILSVFYMMILSKVIDGATIINMLKSTYGITFRDYVINTFVQAPFPGSLDKSNAWT